MELIGRIEIEPGRWATLGRDEIWRGDVGPATLDLLNRWFKPRPRTPAEGWPGVEELLAAAKFFGVRAELAPHPELPPGAVP
jgi:hypothetical protein